MDVRLGETPGQKPDTTQPPSPRLPVTGQLDPGEVERVLERRQRRELRIARTFVECQGVSREDLEEIYQETVIALLKRPYENEKHLCDALRTGIKRRALNLHRDQARRAAILTERAPGIHALEVARSADERPEQVALARQDRLVITEFLAELTLPERRVFWLMTEGMHYNRIATVQGITANEARNLAKSCERKRERFQVLYNSGRLCGYRSQTIKSLLDGEASSEQLLQQATVHLQACAHCRSEFKTNAHRLRQAFQDQAAALLPPMLTSHLDRRSRLGSHLRMLVQRIRPDWTVGTGGARERAVTLLAGGGASAKLAAAGVATVTVIATGTITATHAFEHHQPQQHHRRTPKPPPAPVLSSTRPVDLAEPAPDPPRAVRRVSPGREHHRTPGHVLLGHAAATHPASTDGREPGGFAYLGVPTHTTTPVQASPPAQAATHTGGPFSP